MSHNVVSNTFLDILADSCPYRIISGIDSFTPKNLKDYPFIRANIIPGESIHHALGTNIKEIGLFFITVWFSTTSNFDESVQVAETIKTAFVPRTIDLEDNEIHIEMNWIEAFQYDSLAFAIPIRVRYYNLTPYTL